VLLLLWRMNILLGVTGSVACYKSLDLTRLLTKQGHTVRVLLSKTAASWISPVLFHALSGQKAYTDDDFYTSGMLHIDLTKNIDSFVIAPATANVISSLATGSAYNLITSTFLYFHGKQKNTWVAPAMNPNMYSHPAVQKNLDTLRTYGTKICEPHDGIAVCGDEGKGKLMPIEDIAKKITEQQN